MLKLAQIITEEKVCQKKEAIKKFRVLSTVAATKKGFCDRILLQKVNNYRSAYIQWKNLPYQQGKKHKTKAVEFERVLLKIMSSRLKEVNSELTSNRQ